MVISIYSKYYEHVQFVRQERSSQDTHDEQLHEAEFDKCEWGDKISWTKPSIKEIKEEQDWEIDVESIEVGII